MNNSKRQIIVHPVLFAIFFVVFLYEHNIQLVQSQDLILPLLISILLSVLIWIGLRFIIKNNKKTALIASLIVFVMFSYGHVFILIDDYSINEIDVGKHRFLIIPYGIFSFVGIFYIIRTKGSLQNANIIANIISITIITISFINIGINAEQILFYEENNGDEKPFVSSKQSTPDIYYIILDGYAGSDTLEEVFDYNNDFDELLIERRFYSPTISHSNYPHSFISLASSLNMKYPNIPNNADSDSALKLGHDLIRNNEVMKILKSNGYTVVNFDSGWTSTRTMKIADLNVCGNNRLFNSEFLIILVRTSILNPIYVKLFESDKRERILCTFSELSELQYNVKKPIFAFAHIMSPHPPYLFDSEGNFIIPDEIDASVKSNEKEKYLGQLKFVSKKTVETIDKILQNSKEPPIIIIQSDHGSEVTMDWDNPTPDMFKERMNNINFYYLPYNGTRLLYETITPVNSFRIIFNYYFNENYELLEDKIYFNVGAANLHNFTDITSILR